MAADIIADMSNSTVEEMVGAGHCWAGHIHSQGRYYIIYFQYIHIAIQLFKSIGYD